MFRVLGIYNFDVNTKCEPYFIYVLIKECFFFAFPGLCLGLSCYECENCAENENYLRAHIKQCPDSNYISCLMTESKFAHHKSKLLQALLDFPASEFIFYNIKMQSVPSIC